MKQICLLIFLFTSLLLSGQSMTLERVVLLYNGRQYKEWTNKQIENSTFFSHIYLHDSLLYAAVEGKFYQFDAKSAFPTKISRTSLSKTIQTRLLDSSNSDASNSFKIKNGVLTWENNKFGFSRNLPADSKRSPVVSKWGKPYLVINKKLHRVSLLPSSFRKEYLKQKNTLPLKTFSSQYSPHFVYSSHIFSPQFSQHTPLPQDIQSHENISNILSSPNSIKTTNQPLLLSTNAHLYIYAGNQWFKITHKLKTTEITSFNLRKDTLTIATKNQGLHFTKLPTEKNSVGLSTSKQNEPLFLREHRLNSKLKEFHFISLCNLDNKIYYITKNQGLFHINENKLNINKAPTNIDQVIPIKNSILLLTQEGNIHSFSPSNSKVVILDYKILNYPTLVINDETSIYHKLEDNLIKYDLQTKETNQSAYTLPFETAFVKNRQIHNIINNDLYVTYYNLFSSAKAPTLNKAFLNTNRNKTYQIFPISKEIHLTTDDYPLSFLAEATFLENPSSIEYKYSWQDTKVKTRPYSFDKSHQLRTRLIGKSHAILSLKTGEHEQSFPLTSIVTTRAAKEIDYSIIIYSGAAIIFLLTLALLYGFFKSRKQKNKISKLVEQQRLMEIQQKALQLQMNPHFIFNSLNGVKGMIALGETKNAKQYLTKISGWIRNMLNDARKNKISIGDEVKNLNLYMDIERELRGGSFDYSIGSTCDDSLFIPSMMIQPFIENSIVHAFDGSQENAHIKVDMEQKGRKVVVKIEDNGRGMVEKKTSHKSVAMSLIKERLELWDEGKSRYGVKVVNKDPSIHGNTGVTIILTLPTLD